MTPSPTGTTQRSRTSGEPTCAIVTTTINIPKLLRDYAADAVECKRPLQRFVVAGDRKSPPGTADFCAKLADDFGIECTYLGVEEQIRYLRDFPALGEFLPWNSLSRRNVAILEAYRGGSDIIITIDDDNLLSQPDYLGFHSHVGTTTEIDAMSAASGWWDPCGMLVEARGVPFYHRGFPLSKRWPAKDAVKSSRVTARTVANGGLWLGDPDIDAVARLCFPINATGPGPSFKERLACAVGTWCPFNSQNTALMREAVPGYFLCPFIGRYDDIWASYVIRHISDHLGDVVSYGSPLVKQERNEHNLFNDFDLERFGLEQNDTFLEALRSTSLSGRTYREAFAEIGQQFEERIARVCETRKVDRSLFANVVKGFSVWTETVAQAG